MKQIDLRRFKGDLRVATAEEYVILILEDDDKAVEPMGVVLSPQMAKGIAEDIIKCANSLTQ